MPEASKTSTSRSSPARRRRPPPAAARRPVAGAPAAVQAAPVPAPAPARPNGAAPATRQYELVERVRACDPSADEDALNRAYVFAMRAHGSQTRASGDPYFSHPLEVAGILTDMRLDHRTVITALLHDTVEDTGATLEEIERLFGGEVARLVDGVTKLNRIELQSDRTEQAENFRKFVLAMSEDIRVLLVKLADRLHNMRTLTHIRDPGKRERIARETMEIYAPLAERIGVQDIRDELEDLAFRQLNPDAWESIVNRLDYLAAEGGDFVEDIVSELTRTCEEAGVRARISGRRKSPHSIWLKMRRKHVELEQLSDIVAFRLIVADVAGCYAALGAIHGAYSMLPGRFKDYISTPKPNGYRSIHTGVAGPGGQRVEMQIRTAEMHEVAELGVAAHWNYKLGRSGLAEGQDWLRRFREILDHDSGPEEFLENAKLEMYRNVVFCFTPKGELISLPLEASPVDFAYAVHSEVGDTCVGARINGKLRPLATPLKNGDQVEIVTSKTSRPSPAWESFAKTGKARAAIRRFVRQQRRQQFRELGKAIVQKTFRQAGVRYSEKAIRRAAERLGQAQAEDVLAGVGEGTIGPTEALNAAFPDREGKPEAAEPGAAAPAPRARGRARPGSGTIPLKGLIPGLAVHYARCCHPLPGERIVGIVTTGKGVTIHTIDCETLEGFHSMPERWLDVAWDPDAGAAPHIGRLTMILANEPGSLGSVSTVIGRNAGNIANLRIVDRSVDFFELRVDVEVDDVRHLTNILAALRATPVIASVERARG